MTKKCSSCLNLLDLEEFSTRKDSSDGLRGQCKLCFYKVDKIRRLKLKEKKRQYDVKYRLDNKERLSNQIKDYQEKNKDVIKISRKRYRTLNKKKIQVANRLYRIKNKSTIVRKKREYSQKNKHIVNAISARRRAFKINATPYWSEKSKINNVYKKCKVLSELLGVDMVVDHIIPLNHPEVCGLHVWANLQILESKLNAAKSNKLDWSLK